jgi:signal transduction histidine kinase
MYSTHQSQRPYCLAIAACATVIVLRFELAGILGGFVPLIPFAAAVAIAAWYGGLGPGILATALSAIASYFLFVPDRYALGVATPRAMVGLAVFAVVGWVISWLCELLRRGRDRLEEERARLRASASVQARIQKSLQLSEERERARALELELLTRALQESDRRKNEFLATLAHELRNPLAPIRNLVHILRAKAVGTPDLQWVPELIERQVRQLYRLVDDLSEVALIERGALNVRIQRVDLARLIQGVVEAVRPMIDAEGHELIVSLPDDPVYLEGDAARLSQVFSNLLCNAAKYTERGGRIGVACRLHDGEIEVCVRDNGIGIPTPMLARIFEPFTQLDHGRERRRGGLGIGLALAKQLVETHGGIIVARSSGIGQGTELSVRLPIRAAA